MSTYYTVDFGVNFASQKKYSEPQIKKILNESWNSGVDKVVSISNSIKECHVNVRLSHKYDMVYFTLGIHPHNAKQYTEGDMEILEQFLNNEKCFAVGECGLDYSRMFNPKEKQIEVFKLQIDLAKKYNKKLYLHCRNAYDDFISILKEKQYFNGLVHCFTGLVHCFTGNIKQAREFTNLGFKLGITGWIFDKRRNQDLVNVIKDQKINLNCFVVETDAPYMAIKSARDSVPSDTGKIIEEIARLRNIDVIECGNII